MLPTESKRDLLSACVSAGYEYLLITTPVGLYVALEATRKNELAIFWRSPEWAIATVFLLFQGLSLGKRILARSGAKLSDDRINLSGLVALILTAITLINAYRSLDCCDNTIAAIIVRLVLFFLVSIAFFLFVAAADFYKLRRGNEKDG